MQELEEASRWYLESMPAPAFCITMAAAQLYEALAGHSLVHIVDVGSILGQYMPGLMRRLAAQPCGCPQVSGAAPPVRMQSGAFTVPSKCLNSAHGCRWCIRGLEVHLHLRVTDAGAVLSQCMPGLERSLQLSPKSCSRRLERCTLQLSPAAALRQA